MNKTMKKKINLKKLTKGFSLLELVLVLAIVGVLVGLLLPKGFDALRSSRVRQVQRTVDTLKTAITDYLTLPGGNGSLPRTEGTGVPTSGAALTAATDPAKGNAARLDTVLLATGKLERALTLKMGGNLLLLDEPTNDLDVETLQSLEKQGLVEKVPGVEPQHWRLAPSFRLGRAIIDVANLIERGEWTSYGDISQVVYGHYKGGPAVASAIRNSPDFENHHRILRYDGEIAPDWEEAGLGRDECASRLEGEGVEVDEYFYAHGRHRVDHEELARRLDESRR